VAEMPSPEPVYQRPASTKAADRHSGFPDTSTEGLLPIARRRCNSERATLSDVITPLPGRLQRSYDWYAAVQAASPASLERAIETHGAIEGSPTTRSNSDIVSPVRAEIDFGLSCALLPLITPA